HHFLGAFGMARNPRIQLPFTEQLYSRLESYQKHNQFSTLTDATKDLIEFALAIKERMNDSSSKSTREILEEVLAVQYLQEKLSKQMYMAAFDPTIRVQRETADIVNEKFNKFSEEAKEKSNKFISGKE
ncbi:hypothetical protein, partial [Photobacterium damselae]|uniref:hypothetical protein n=2 Tax=Photobacterium damselae TaxID=38293 RepID=UPI0040693E54